MLYALSLALKLNIGLFLVFRMRQLFVVIII